MPVVIAPTITTPPVSSSVVVGAEASFTVVATGTAPLTYQWAKGGVAIAGATDSTYKFTTTATTDSGVYTVTVGNSAGTVTSAAATLTVTAAPPVVVAPTITTPPANLTVIAGQDVSFSVVAAGTSPFTYQWTKGGSAIQGATANPYTFRTTATADAGDYAVIVTNSAGSKTSATATLTVLPLVELPVITLPPANLTVVVGDPVHLSVTATSSAAMTYQWLKDDVAIPGATSATFDLNAAALTDAGTYKVKVHNSGGDTTSAGGVLTVRTSPVLTIATQPKDVVAICPDPATFKVVVNGGVNPTFQWQVNGTDIVGATSNTFTTTPTDFQLFGLTSTFTYKVKVTDEGVEHLSDPAVLTVMAPNPTYPPAGDPKPVNSRQLTVLNSMTVDPVHFPNGSFRVGYDEELKNPAWTAYGNFRVSSIFTNSDREFLPDPRLQAPQVSGSDMGSAGHGNTFYTSSLEGFDRGHMVMMSDISYRYSDQAGLDATIMSNIIPQASALNQKLWVTLEQAIGGKNVSKVFDNGLTASFGRVWVYTGPIFTGTINYWVPSLNTYVTDPSALKAAGTLTVAIPTACYKIVVAEPIEGQSLPRAMAIVVYNRTNTNSVLLPYVTSVARIEALTGLDFFPNLPHDANLDAWKAAVDVRGWGANFEKIAPTAPGPNVHVIKPSWDLTPITTNQVLRGERVLEGEQVDFEGAATPNASNPTGTIASTVWNFGDSTPTATGYKVSHVYNTAGAGNYSATFTATDNLGNSNVVTRLIKVVTAASTANTAPSFGYMPEVMSTGVTPGPATTNIFVSDTNSVGGNIRVTATSSNQSILKDSDIQLTQIGGDITLKLTPTGTYGNCSVIVTATDEQNVSASQSFNYVVALVSPYYREDFEVGTRSGYTPTGTVTLSGGDWNFTQALLGNTGGSDRMNGRQSIRVQKAVAGSVGMNFDYPYGASTVSVQTGMYGTDGTATWTLSYSTNGGTSWTPVAPSSIVQATWSNSGSVLTNHTFTVNVSGPIRFKIDTLASSAGRLNIDDFKITNF